MLKLIYTENGFDMKHLAQPFEEWVTSRVIIYLRAGISLCIEPSTASFLLPCDLPDLEDLEQLTRRENGELIALSVCDDQYIEVSLQGSWLSEELEGEEGVFACAMSNRVEFFLFKLWQEAQAIALRE